MKLSTLSMIAVLGIFATPAVAQDFDTSAGLAYKPTLAQSADDEGTGYRNRDRGYDDNETVYADATCSAPGTDQYSVIVQDSGMGPVWHMTNDTRSCSQAGIADPTWKGTDN